MKTIKWSLVVGASLGLSSVAFANVPNLNCPAGSVQVQTKQLEVGCQQQGAHPQVAFEGRVLKLHKNGLVAEEGMQANGLRVGTWTFFDEKGNKTVSVEFDRSQLHGKRTEFYANGMVKKVETFENDRRVGAAQEFDIAGRPVTPVTTR